MKVKPSPAHNPCKCRSFDRSVSTILAPRCCRYAIGWTSWLSYPTARGHMEDAGASDERAHEQMPGTHVACPARVLFIDDEVDAALVRWLSADGWTVDHASTGAHGLARARAVRSNIIVLDLHLTDMIGLTVLSELRRARLGVPVVVITGWFMDDDHRTTAKALGAAAYLYKPIFCDEFDAVLTTALLAAPPEILAPLTESPVPATRRHSNVGAAPPSARLQEELQAGDDSAWGEVWSTVRPKVEGSLRWKYRAASADWVHDAVVDALSDRGHLAKYDPSRGKSLPAWLLYAAERNLLNRLQRERGPALHEVALSDVQMAAVAGPRTDLDRRRHVRTLVKAVLARFTSPERAMLALWWAGERRTSRLAEAAQIPPGSEQERRVKAVKDRFVQSLRREGRR